jgi:hypothetical protein
MTEMSRPTWLKASTKKGAGVMWKRAIALGLATAIVLAGGVVAATASGQGVGQPQTLTGAWLVTVDRGPLGPLKALQTFARGGVLTETSNAVPSRVRGPGHGAWRRAGNGYDATELFIRFDPQTGDFVGYVKLRMRIQLDSDGDSFTSVTVAQPLDTDGNPVGPPRTDSSVGVRLDVEPLPN